MPVSQLPEIPTNAPPEPPAGKDRPRRYADLEQHELLHLLDEYEDERARARFREAIYISFIFWVAAAWFVLFFVPKHFVPRGRIIPQQMGRPESHELATLDTPRELIRRTPPRLARPTPPPPAPAESKVPVARPTPTPPTPPATRAPAIKPLPAAPQPQVQPVQPMTKATPPPLPIAPAPKPVPSQPAAAVPDAPRPSFTTPGNASDSMRELARNAARNHSAAGAGSFASPIGHTGGSGSVEMLSDPMGVDFGPYINRLLMRVRAAWIPLLPEEVEPPLSKEGSTLIRFRIEPNGRISYMNLDDSTHDDALNKAAWASINSQQGSLPPLPADFKGPNLDLRIQFVVSHKYAGDR